MEIKKINLTNFGKFETLNVDLSKNTEIAGKNASGKSTIKKAAQWIFNCKDENGKEITGIRPHDENGVDKADVVTEATATLSDGTELMKRFYLNKAGTGNTTDYFVNGIPKKKSDYEEIIREYIPNDVCINAQAFFNLDTSKRREKLQTAFGGDAQEITASIIAENPDLAEVEVLLKHGTVAEIKQACNLALNGTKGKKGLVDSRDEIPSQIAELERLKVDVDVAELELAKNSLTEQIEALKAKRDTLSVQMEETLKSADGVMELQFEINDIKRKANEENDKARRAAGNRADDCRAKINRLASDVKARERDIARCETMIAAKEIELKEHRASWREFNATEFDEDELYCPTCGQEFPDDQKEEIIKNFNKGKSARLKEFKASIEADEEYIASIEAESKAYVEELDKLKAEIENLIAERETAEDELASLPLEIDTSNNAEIKALEEKIAEKKQAVSKHAEQQKEYNDFSMQIEGLQAELSEVNGKIANSNRNVEIDERISELQKKQIELSQQIADQQKRKYLVMEFDRKKNEALESVINKNFQYINVKMFEPTVDGSDFKDVCQITYNGTNYDNGLNHGARLLAEIDICRAFQKAYGRDSFILLEDAESLNEWLVPKMDCQLISFKVTGEELRISEVK
jgi:predicted  nucleic acid-binding Zn-ribbon protein